MRMRARFFSGPLCPFCIYRAWPHRGKKKKKKKSNSRYYFSLRRCGRPALSILGAERAITRDKRRIHVRFQESDCFFAEIISQKRDGKNDNQHFYSTQRDLVDSWFILCGIRRLNLRGYVQIYQRLEWPIDLETQRGNASHSKENVSHKRSRFLTKTISFYRRISRDSCSRRLVKRTS